mmetsp:Transcript_21246/g.54754  ORF Transcript_21246/g.54754 Transcript_21246/m.54754 type:complete len:218 (+) Transcript_21246:3756-4409(+)
MLRAPPNCSKIEDVDAAALRAHDEDVPACREGRRAEEQGDACGWPLGALRVDDQLGPAKHPIVHGRLDGAAAADSDGRLRKERAAGTRARARVDRQLSAATTSSAPGSARVLIRDRQDPVHNQVVVRAQGHEGARARADACIHVRRSAIPPLGVVKGEELRGHGLPVGHAGHRLRGPLPGGGDGSWQCSHWLHVCGARRRAAACLVLVLGFSVRRLV